jgi:hypothetical protein
VNDPLTTLLFQLVIIADIVSITAFVLIYSKLAPWWRNPIGRTIVIKDILLTLVLIPSALSLFLHFSRLTSEVASWLDIVLLGSITPVMLWRIRIWFKIHGNKVTDAD